LSPPTAATTNGLLLPPPLLALSCNGCIVLHLGLSPPLRLLPPPLPPPMLAVDATRHWRYSSSVISATPLGVAIKRGEDPAGDGSHGGEEGGGIKDDNNKEYHKGGGGGTAKLSCPPPPLTLLGQLPMSALQLLLLGTLTVFIIPQRSADIAGIVFQYLLIGMYSFC
jgi:hypothetical protein